jgi:hypothetical protein
MGIDQSLRTLRTPADDRRVQVEQLDYSHASVAVVRAARQFASADAEPSA